MADEKKPEKKEEPYKDPFVEIVSVVIALFFVIFVINSLSSSFKPLFSNGLKGFTTEGILSRYTRPIASLYNPIGSKIINLRDTTVYNSPLGRILGSQPFMALGTILQGPESIENIKFLYVDYDKGLDGWVMEDRIAYKQGQPNILERFIIFISSSAMFFIFLSIFISIILIILLVVFIKRLLALRKAEQEALYPQIESSVEQKINPKWKRILDHIESPNENDWRLAIMEADIILNSLIDQLSLTGETMGEKMKLIEKSDFRTIDNAWEAHKIRNQIAHEGADFPLSQREAKRVIDLYKTVFEEFGMI